MLNLLSERFRLRPLHRSRVAHVDCLTPDVRLTGTQIVVRDALVGALQDGAEGVVLTAAANLGKTTILTAALARLHDPALQVLRLDNAASGLDDAFHMLFAPVRQRLHRRQPRERRIVIVIDQAETMPPETFAFLELLIRMPSKEASIQWIIAGRPLSWDSPGGPTARWLQEVGPVRLTLPALSEQDAWELFHHRVVSGYGVRSAPKLVAALLQQSGGLPGRLDAALGTAVAAGLLKGVPARTA